MTDKYRMYIDESGNSDLGSCDNPNHRFLCLCGVIMNLDYVNNIFSSEFENFKNDVFGKNADNPIILHRNDILNYRGAFGVLKNEQTKEFFNKCLLELLERWDFKIITVLIDKKEFKDLYLSWKEHPYHYCLQILIERYCSFLRQYEAMGDVMIESRNKNDDRLLSAEFNKIYKDGTSFWEGEDIRIFLTSSQIKIKSKKMNIAGLQLADLIVQPMRNRILEHYELKDKSENKVFGDVLTDTVKRKIYKGKNGKYWGCGLKKLP